MSPEVQLWASVATDVSQVGMIAFATWRVLQSRLGLLIAAALFARPRSIDDVIRLLEATRDSPPKEPPPTPGP